MSAQAPANFTEWLQNLPIPWLTAGAVGSKWATATGTVVDTYVGYMKQGIKARMPDFAPTDALPHIGADRKLIQGPNESNASFVARLVDAWGEWSRAGQARGVLEQLAYYTQSNAAIWVQQNGNAYTLSSMPTAGTDPTSLVVQTNLSTLPETLSSSASPYRTIPAGTPWWFFDSNTDLCNRFAIIYPSWPFSALTTAYFSGTDSAAITWPFTFGSSVYSILVGAPVVTDGSGGVVLHADGTTQTTTGVTIRASGPFTGYASVVAYAAGVNPLNMFSSANSGQLQSVIATFRPNAICVGVFAMQSGRQWGYPTTVKWGDGGTWGGSVSTILGQF
jgi:hypothetical protein